MAMWKWLACCWHTRVNAVHMRSVDDFRRSSSSARARAATQGLARCQAKAPRGAAQPRLRTPRQAEPARYAAKSSGSSAAAPARACPGPCSPSMSAGSRTGCFREQGRETGRQGPPMRPSHAMLWKEHAHEVPTPAAYVQPRHPRASAPFSARGE
eukprot:358674-Chlamydomonas_euryale.AAC.5